MSYLCSGLTSFTMWRGSSPLRNLDTLSTQVMLALISASLIAPAVWGVRTTFPRGGERRVEGEDAVHDLHLNSVNPYA